MHIYIHIPFCTSKCLYCAFGSFDNRFNLVDDYFKSLLFEIENFDFKEKISTIFIGGGTPSAVSSKYYAKICEILAKNSDENIEFTTEANPNSLTRNWLKDMMSFGVNRVSFGAQSFNEDKLKFLGRSHNSAQIHKALECAKNLGMKNINIDLIYDTKFDTKKNLEFELENIKNLDISHISAYSLIIEENTPFESKFTYKKNSPNLAKFLFRELENLGLFQYEIANFGQICKHNLSYWKGEDYAGFGLSSVGTFGYKRLKSSENLEEYIKNPLHKSVEILTQNDKKIERIFLGLRSIVGVEEKILNQDEQKRAEILIKNRKLTKKDGKIFNKNFLLADEIALFIMG